MKPKLAVWKFASCDGCQLSLVDATGGLMELSEYFDLSLFPELSSYTETGPYDLSLVEGSIATDSDRAMIQEVRRQSRWLVTIGACATAGGIQALKNYRDSAACLGMIYAEPAYIDTLSIVSPIAACVPVDYELRGCPVNPNQLTEVIAAFIWGRTARISASCVCLECKAGNIPCLLVSDSVPCLGPITHSGCGALCPAFNRGCFGCFGGAESVNSAALGKKFGEFGFSPEEFSQLLIGFNPCDEAFACEAIDE